MKTKAILFFIFSLLISACNQGSVDSVASNTVQTSQVYQIYDIEASKNETKIVATFRVGGATGTTLELTAPGKILYNGDELAKSDPTNLIGTNYRVKGTDYRLMLNKYQPSHEFAFTDNDGKTYKNSLNLLPVEISANGGLTLQKAQPTTIMLSRSVGKDEFATVAVDSGIDDPVPTADGSVYLNAEQNAVVIAPKYWETKQLKTKVSLQIKVKKTATIAQGANLGGSISASFAAAPVFVSVNNAKTNVNASANNAKPTVNANVKAANAATNTAAKPTANANANK